MSEAPPLSAADRAKALDIKSSNMYVFKMKHPFTDEVHGEEHYMVIKTANGRKFVFRQKIDMAPPKRIIT